jgi:molybdopterin synthase catalytic subunit
MPISLHPEAFDPWALLGEYQSRLPAGGFGATAVFVGTMRDFNEGDDVRAMTLEHYPGMTEKHLQDITTEARKRWDLDDCLIAHRVGPIEPGDPIVLTAVWSAHRKAAFEACRYLMEELKHRAPFWKQETLSDGTNRWVEKNTEG